MKQTFRDRVYEILRNVPKGNVVTYGQLAKLAGRPNAARAVGSFMRTNPDAPHTPCHRVVAANGSLTGYSAPGGVRKKKQMLLTEGIKFIGDKVNLSVSCWRE